MKDYNMTPDGIASAEEILQRLNVLMKELAKAHDCRILLGALVGCAGSFGAALRMTGIMSEEGLRRIFTAGFDGAMMDNESTPRVEILGQNAPGSGVKQ